jgi:hypothetical protein
MADEMTVAGEKPKTMECSLLATGPIPRKIVQAGVKRVLNAH